MTELHNDLTEIKQTLQVMKDKIDVLELKMNTVNPQCYMFDKPIYTTDMPLTTSAAKSFWPMLEKEFEEYCSKHNITMWTQADSEQFYNEYIGVGADWPMNEAVYHMFDDYGKVQNK